MKDYEPTKEQMRAIVEMQLRQIGQEAYAAEVSKRVADRLKDEAMAQRHIKALEKLEMMKDEYKAVLKELESPETQGEQA